MTDHLEDTQANHATKGSGTPKPSGGNGRVAVFAASIAVVMLGMSYAAVPLYQMFCQVTGFAGTTQRAEKAPDKSQILDRRVIVRFDANVSSKLSWKIKPVEETANVKYGENHLTFYTRDEYQRSAGNRNGELQRRPGCSRRLLQQDRVFLLHRANTGARRDR